MAVTRTVPDNPEIPEYRLEKGYKPKLDAFRAESKPKIDAYFDDDIWQKAPAGGPLIQNVPSPGKPMDQQTEFRVAYDSRNVYVAIWC